ncbi:uncharacterized protein [Littorina saxatilis]|uniref:uncharacterized protein isoform X2 n=1 Tax=Littorina saxatilis TaxID=31220 RepID=UPI0038B635E9
MAAFAGSVGAGNSKEGGEVCSEVEGGLTEITMATVNGMADVDRDGKTDHKMEIAVDGKDNTPVLNGGVLKSDHSSPTVPTGYLTLSGGCLTLKRSSDEVEKQDTSLHKPGPNEEGGKGDNEPSADTKHNSDKKDVDESESKPKENGSAVDNGQEEPSATSVANMNGEVNPPSEESPPKMEEVTKEETVPDSEVPKTKAGSQEEADKSGVPIPSDSHDLHPGSNKEEHEEKGSKTVELTHTENGQDKVQTEAERGPHKDLIPSVSANSTSSNTDKESCASVEDKAMEGNSGPASKQDGASPVCEKSQDVEMSTDKENEEVPTDKENKEKSENNDTSEKTSSSPGASNLNDTSEKTSSSPGASNLNDTSEKTSSSPGASNLNDTSEKTSSSPGASNLNDTSEKTSSSLGASNLNDTSDKTSASLGASNLNDTSADKTAVTVTKEPCVGISSSVASNEAGVRTHAEKASGSVKVQVEPTIQNSTPSSLKSEAQPVSAVTSIIVSKPSPSKSTARKSVPGGMKQTMYKATARKTGQPQSKLALASVSAGQGTIKIVNLHPNSNITLKLSELEEVLKVKEPHKASHMERREGKESSPASTGLAKSASESQRRESSPALSSAASDTSSQHYTREGSAGLHLKLKRRRKRGGTYDLPGKKRPRKKKGLHSSAESRDEDDFNPLRKINKKAIGSRRQYTVVELLNRNRSSPFRKRLTVHGSVMRRKSSDSPTKRTVSQMLQERRKSGPVSPEAASVQKTLAMLLKNRQHSKSGSSGAGDKKKTVSRQLDNRQISGVPIPGDSPDGEKRRIVQKLFVTKDGLVSSVNIEDASEEENVEEQKTPKRKFPVGGPLAPSGTTEWPVAKKQKMVGADGDNTVPSLLQPMVMVVAQHNHNSPGLRSILPKPHMAIAVSAASFAPTSGSGPRFVNSGQMRLLSGQPFMVKPGTKVAFVPATATGKNTFSLLPTSVVSSSKGMAVPVSTVPSLAKLVNIRGTVPSTTSSNSDALRALLASTGGVRPQAVSFVPTSFAQGVSSVSAARFAQHKVLNMSSMAGSKFVGVDGKVATSLPNGLLLPVTPPKTPEGGEATVEGMATTASPDSDTLPLCCCKIVGAYLPKLSLGATYCQALDSVDGKALGCCNKVSNLQLVRPGVKIPFMAVCEVHRKRLKLHQCCPGCGHFSTQGKFYQCRKEGSSVHHFHRQCQTEKDGKLFCPHCGEESGQVEVTLTLNEPQVTQTNEQIRANLRKSISKARMTPCSLVKKKGADTQAGVTLTLPCSKTVSSDGLPIGPDRGGLEKLMQLCINKAERPKKYRILPKNMYIPASEGDLEKVFYMLVDGMDPNQICEEEDNQTVLHGAIYSGNLALVYLLVQAGACLHTPDKTLKTPLMCAAEYGYLGILKMLSKAGARLDDRGEDHMTCLHYAAKAGHLDIIQYILERRTIDVNSTDEGGWTPIMWATESQLVDVVNFLVSRGGDPSKKDNEENTALHWAAFAGSLEITELFLDLGCELDTPNEHGDRPLHIAARQDHYEVVVILLARGANVDLRNNKDETPVQSCHDHNGQVCMALKVNKQLRSFAARHTRPEKLVHRDVSLGREKNPIACVNAVDDEPHPTDYLYVDHNVETQDLHINNVITSLQSCRCKDDCSSVYCVCSRSSVKCWFDKFGRLVEDFNVLDPPLIFECNRACRCWVNCNNRVVQNGITVRMQVFKTHGRGFGVRSLMDIPKGTFICEYIGELISDSEADRREDDSYLFDLDNKDGDTYCLDARKYGNVARFINHLCEPNLVPVKVFIEHQDLRFPRICFFSSRDIKAYEELGFDYGEKFWIIKWKQFTCACGSPKCKYSTETIKRTLEEYRMRHEDEDLNQES